MFKARQTPRAWLEFAQKMQIDVMQSDAADPGVPISNHDAKRGIVHTRQDLVMVLSLTTALVYQLDEINSREKMTNRLLAIIALLVLILILRV